MIEEQFHSSPRIILNERQLCDLELLLTRALAPLSGFMTREETESVLDSFHLPNNVFWPMPIPLFVNSLEGVEEGKPVLLCDPEGTILAELDVKSIWEMEKQNYVERLFKTKDKKHPGVDDVLCQSGPFCLGGELKEIRLPKHHTFLKLRHTPFQFKEILKKSGIKKIVAFNTRNPMHRAHVALTIEAMERMDGALLIHPVVGPTKPGDIDYITRVKCYQAILNRYPSSKTVFLSLLPLAMRMAGPREALLHGIIRKNYGCTHFIVGRDHAGPGRGSNGHSFYAPYEAQELFLKYEKEIEIKMIPFQKMVYVPGQKKYLFCEEAPKGETVCQISGTQLRSFLNNNEPIPDWFTFPEVHDELKKVFPPKSHRGLVLFFTGFSGSGKSTIANCLTGILREQTSRSITLLDGDIVRQNLSKGLGFSKEDRDTNIRRIGFVAGEVVKHGGICICCAIAPYEEIRRENRQRVLSLGGNYIEIYLSTPLAECKKRDPKGIYALSKKGELKQLTGIDDPYEAPKEAEIVIDASQGTSEEAARKILDYLCAQDYLLMPNLQTI